MRKSGILFHLSSLSSPYGIGTMGNAARAFVDFLAEAGQTCWQLLPICPTSYGDSPYQSFSTFAGNPYFIDLEILEQEGYLKSSEYVNIDWESAPDDINYGVLYEKRYPVLKLAAERFLRDLPADYEPFCRENSWWLEDFSLFMALKDSHGGAPWWEWEPSLQMHEPEAVSAAEQSLQKEIAFWKVTQYLFFSQWRNLKRYANEKGISIIGDLPIYVSRDSADVWCHPELFQLDENHIPREVAGCPPDGFSADGQLWGNPLFDWEYMEKDNYAWWVRRIGYLTEVYDILRIDHFRGFDSYYAIPFGSDNARNGRWRTGPGMRLFNAVNESIGKKDIIAEDLGFLTDSVRELLRESGFPGMRVLEFAFDSRDKNGNDYLPHKFIPHCIAYTGTHDNETLLGWKESADPADVAYAAEYLRLNEEEGFHWGVMRALWGSVADLTVVQAQDILGIGSGGRMNTPSTVGKNWRWRALPGVFTHELARKLRRSAQIYGRFPR